MRCATLKLALALAAVSVCLPAPALAQELRKDSVWNGVVVGAAIGGSLGVVVAKTPADICSVRDCALLFAVAGGWLGHLTDSAIGAPAPVVPGQWTDDSKWTGALIGAGVGSAVLLIDRARGCGPGRQLRCGAGDTLRLLWKSALFGAAAGALVDAAIPTRAPGETGSTPAGSRRFLLTYSIRF